MLFRLDVLELGDAEAWEKVRRVSVQAFSLRLWLPELLFVTSGRKTVVPSCHVVAHAFARVFGYEVKDGEHCYSGNVQLTPDQADMDVHFTTVLHSWVEFETAHGNRFILDIFPDEGGSIFPVLYRAPHPCYWIPRDEKRVRILAALPTDKSFQRDVTMLSRSMMAMAHKANLLSD